MASALGPLAFWEGYEGELLTLAVYGVGFAIYALLVGLFYNTLSQRNLVAPERGRKRMGPFAYLLAFPIVSFGFFLVLSLALFFLAKRTDASPVDRAAELLLISMALVAGVRVAAYISEGAAADLGKLVPLGLLGVLLVDPGFFTFNAPFERLAALPELLPLIARYFVAIIVLEVLLRLFWVLSGGRARARAREAAAVRHSPPALQQR